MSQLIFELGKSFLLKKKWFFFLIVILSIVLAPLQIFGVSNLSSRIIGGPKHRVSTRVFMLIVLFVVIEAILALRRMVVAKQLPFFKSFIASSLYDTLQEEQEHQAYRDTSPSTTISSLDSLMYHLPIWCNQLVSTTLPVVIMLIVFTVYLFRVGKRFALCAVLFYTLLIVVVYTTTASILRQSQDIMSKDREIKSTLEDSISNMDNIIASGAQAGESRRVREKTEAKAKLEESMQRTKTFFSIGVGVLLIALFATVNLLALRSRSKAVFGSLLLVSIAIIRYVSPELDRVPSLISEAGTILESGKRFSVSTHARKGTLSHEPKTLKLRKLTYFHPASNDARPLFNQLNLTVRQGDRIVIRGESGQGKSSLIKIVAGFLMANQGTVSLDYVSISNVSPGVWKQHVFFLGQATRLFTGTIFDNMLFGTQIQGLGTHDLEELLEHYGLSALFHKGLNETVGEGAAQGGGFMSGGQKKVILLTRAMLRAMTPTQFSKWFPQATRSLRLRPTFMLFDEPLVALDDAIKKRVVDMLRDLPPCLGIVYVSHLPEISQLATAHYQLSKGTLHKQR